MSDEHLDSLYDDLSFDVPATTSSNNNDDEKMEPVATVPDELHKTIAKLQQELAHVQAENAQLKTNISVLFKTAQAELKQKDLQIQQLQMQMAVSKHQPSFASSPQQYIVKNNTPASEK